MQRTSIKKIEKFACNPVGKARIIVEAMTEEGRIQSKLLEIITHNLSGKEIEQIYEELKPKYQLKLNL